MNLLKTVVCALLFVSAHMMSGHAYSVAEETTGEPASEVSADVESILTTPSESEYVESTRCLSTQRIRRAEVLDDRHVVFHLSRKQYYLVQFQHRCPMMQRDSIVVYEVQGSRLCEMDRMHAVNGLGAGQTPGPSCLIPRFQEITKEQLALLKETLKAQRRNRGAPPVNQVDPLPAPPDAPDAVETPDPAEADQSATDPA